MLIWLESSLHFGLLSVVALGTTNGTRSVAGLGAVVFGGVMMRLDSWLFSLATISPFFTIIWLLPLAFGALAGMRAAQVQQRSFRRYLDACTLNDHDAEAHIQLGLLYHQRGQTDKATAHFKRAIEIDPHEPDANFQL
jgi:tetratricopeptide (TPR) repeat protein